MPFDAYLVTPNLQFSFDMHLSESLSVSTIVGGGYGLKNATYAELESPTYGVAPDAYRYLSSILAGVQYAPIYAKMNLNGARVVHYDVYGTARGGITLEQSVIPSGGIAVAPTVSLGIGTRFFWGDKYAIRVELRDDCVIERRKLTASTHFKQNANITVGFTMLSPVKGETIMKRPILQTLCVALALVCQTPSWAAPTTAEESASDVPEVTLKELTDEERTALFQGYDEAIKRGQKTSAADALLPILDDPELGLEHGDAWVKMGTLLVEFDMEYSALLAFGNAVNADPTTGAQKVSDAIALAKNWATSVS